MAYGSLGMTHHATEDLAFMRAMPNLVVVAPNDPVEAKLATRAVVGYDGPCYLRLGRQGEKPVHKSDPEFVIGKVIRMREGSDATLFVTGGLLQNTLAAAEQLESQGISAAVVSAHTLKPFDTEAVIEAARNTPAIFTIEEHSIIGGLGGAVAETLLESDVRPKIFKRLGLPGTEFSKQIGDQDYLRREFGLDADGIASTISRALRG